MYPCLTNFVLLFFLIFYQLSSFLIDILLSSAFFFKILIARKLTNFKGNWNIYEIKEVCKIFKISFRAVFFTLILNVDFSFFLIFFHMLYFIYKYFLNVKCKLCWIYLHCFNWDFRCLLASISSFIFLFFYYVCVCVVICSVLCDFQCLPSSFCRVEWCHFCVFSYCFHLTSAFKLIYKFP